jgi:hypothetical protein
MIALVGEQPIPILLPVRYLQPTETILVCTKETEDVVQRLSKLIPQCHSPTVKPYEFDETLDKIRAAISDKNDLIFNLTGGTKMMALAAFAVVSETQGRFVYLQSEGLKSLLIQYKFDKNGRVKPDAKIDLELQTEVQPLITAEDYLNAHLPGFRLAGFSCDEAGNLSDGGKFEQEIYNILKSEFDVLPNVRPEGVADQIEIDLVIRCQNHVAIAEVKLGDAQGEGPRHGLDQLAMAGRREYLGTYTVKFLITGRQLTSRVQKRIQTLAQEANIEIIQPSRGIWNARNDRDRLIKTIKDKLCGR